MKFVKDRPVKELNKWQVVLYCGRAFESYDKRMFRFGIFNIQKFPKEGEGFSKEHYKGFVFTKRFRSPLTLLRSYLESKGF